MRKIVSWVAAAVLLSIAGAGLSLAQQAPPPAGPGAGAPGRGAAAAPPPPFRITSPDLVDGSALPQQFTCAAGAQAVSPALQWVNPPRGTVSMALLVHDLEPRPQKKLDDILHWMVWNIPATATKFPQGVPSNTPDLPDGSHQTNGNPQGGVTGYLPPCPPQNVALPHHYEFDLFALDTQVDLPPTATRADLMKIMDGHILGHDSLVVLFNR